jgi:mannose-6-phosphate isomerase-like protein (cupin superfamily)
MTPQRGLRLFSRAWGNSFTPLATCSLLWASCAETNQTLTLMFDTRPPGGGPPPHLHSKEDELFLVVESRVSFFVQGVWTEVASGGAVYFPRGTAHYYRSIGATPSRPDYSVGL